MNKILEDTKYLMKKYNIRANKNLGQNFLINEEVAEEIICGSEIGKNDLVIEIGPGLGNLTKMLLEKAKKLICIELDSNMVNILNERFSMYKNFEILNEDILKVNLKNIIKKEKENNNIENVKVVANLPYYITTPIITKLLEDKLELESITVMMQKEVAKRLIEIPGGKETGAITYCIYYYCEAKKIIEVAKSSFIPEPKVTSEVIKLKIRKEPPVKVAGKAIMFKIIKCAYMQRRKTILNSLTNKNVFENKEEGTKIFEKLKIDTNTRPEKLTMQDFANITNEYIKLMTNK